MTSWQIIEGDCLEVMRSMAADAYDAIVTSPPYADQRTYNGTCSIEIHEYRDWLVPFLREMRRVVKPTGSLMLNVGRAHRGGYEQPMPLDALAAAQDSGWGWLDTIIWQKPNAFIAASAPYLHNTHEYVWWLGDPPAYRGYDADTRTPHSENTLARYAQGFRTNRSKDGTRYHREGKPIAAPHSDGARPKSVVTFASSDHRGIDHPAPMSAKLARHLVCLSCPPGGEVLDPFAGSGTTVMVALAAGRSAVGIEAVARYADAARRRIVDDAPLLNAPREAA